MLPVQIPFVKPKLRVREGETVARGDALFHDKRNPRVRFLAPGGGTVETIDFGARRVIRKIVIRLGDPEPAVAFDALAEGGEGLVQALLPYMNKV